GDVAGQRRRQQAVTVAKERRESLFRAKRLCRVDSYGDDDDDPHVENEMMIDEEQPVPEAQTSKAVEELKSAVQYQVTALRELRRLLSKPEFPPIEAALSAGAVSFVWLSRRTAWCLTNIAAGKPEETKALLPALPLLIAHLGEKSSLPVAEQCSWAIGNVAREGEDLRNVLLSQGALPPLARVKKSVACFITLVMFFRHHPFDIRKEVAYVLGNLCVESAEGDTKPRIIQEHLVSIVSGGCLPGFINLVRSPDIEDARLGLQFIELVLRGMPNGEGSKLVEGEDGIDAMERFQWLRVMANSVVDKYFGEDYGINEWSLG
ncbi:hypothetical protein DY000_02019901, partial [Brassica cretica]